MTQIANQKQMDSMLEVLSPKFRKEFGSKKFEKKQFVQTFDFRRRNQLSRDIRRSLERIHESFGKETSIFLNNRLRSNVRFKLNSVKQYSIEEYYEILQNPTNLYLIKLTPQNRNVVIEIRHDLSFYILDRLLGGPGSTNYENRELTRIELKVIENIVNDILKTFHTSWEKTAEFEYSIQNYFNSGDYLQFVRRGDSVVTLAYQVSIDDKIHLNNVFNITYPFMLIEELIPIIELDSKDPPRQSSKVEQLVLRDNVSTIKAPVIVDLGYSKLSIHELMKLQIGDVIMLNTQTNDELPLRVGKQRVFKGHAGMLKNKMAYRIIK